MLSLFFLLPIFNTIIAVGSLGLLLVTALLTYDLIAKDGAWFSAKLQPFLWPLIIGTTVFGVVMSLTYSEIFLFVPCSLCWLQRIALYPQAILSIVAWRAKDTLQFPRYGIALAIFGMVVAMYQYVYQILPEATRDSIAPCLADGSANCADKVIDMFGFVTFPLISAITFAFLITLYSYQKKASG